ncbi:MAG: aldehyde dehydrogenase (NADP(+)) [Chloroflexi bacterium]|nr:aldehyde dehydrogenase (NADP(+)) [Chloroflexota bacterium]
MDRTVTESPASRRPVLPLIDAVRAEATGGNILSEPILLNGRWEHAAEEKTFQSVNPTTGEPLPYEFPVSPLDIVEAMIQAGAQAAAELRDTSLEARAAFLKDFADRLEANREAIVSAAYTETALSASPRLQGELDRTVNQLRQAAWAVEDRSWVTATIDTANNIRSMFGPLGGPVVVFGPNNFPLAFNGASGGDFAAAIASGNPVIAKANPSHAHTTRLLAQAALESIQATGVPRATVQMLYRTAPENGLRLVSHPAIGATAFTGSKAGLNLKRAADAAGKPIYLELSSVNPVFILAGALDERLESIADALYASCTLGAGQFCTNPGLVFLLASDASERFIEQAGARFDSTEGGILLSEYGPESMAEAVQTWEAAGASRITGGARVPGERFRFQNTLYRVSAQTFMAYPSELQTEAFGAASLVIVADSEAELVQAIGSLEGNLTGSIYSHTGSVDDALYDAIEPALRGKVGRLLNDKMPTGVTVSPAMNHGGPFPSTGHPGFTAVGIPASLHRFAALYSYDNVRPHRLPPELQDRNPTGTMWRYIDRAWTQSDVG